MARFCLGDTFLVRRVSHQKLSVFLSSIFLFACTKSGESTPPAPPTEQIPDGLGKTVSPLPTVEQLELIENLSHEQTYTLEGTIFFQRTLTGKHATFDREKEIAQLMKNSNCDFKVHAKDAFDSNDACLVKIHVADSTTKPNWRSTVKNIDMNIDSKDALMNQTLDVTHLDLKGQYSDVYSGYNDSTGDLPDDSTETIKTNIIGNFISTKYGKGQMGHIRYGQIRSTKLTQTGKTTDVIYLKTKDFTFELRTEVIYDGTSDPVWNYYVNGNKGNQYYFDDYEKHFTFFAYADLLP